MKAYIIADIEIKNEAEYVKYRDAVPALVKKYGGQYIVRGGNPQNLEGSWSPKRVVILEFPDMETLQRFYGSVDYAPLIKQRQAGSDGSIICLQGV
ncbi:MAG TPA: DUF1330 domain-containing protein [Candidatus Baltobacteraceae bacterium]|jgi:uncharacterized protein (DUF1330 family)